MPPIETGEAYHRISLTYPTRQIAVKILFTLATALFLVSLNAFAGSSQEGCHGQPTHADVHQCVETAAAESTKQLAAEERALQTMLRQGGQEVGSRKAAASALAASGEQYRRYRDGQRTFEASLVADGNSDSDLRLVCIIDQNQRRIGDLRKARR